MPALHITTKQMTAFEAARFEDFRALMVKHLRETVGEPFTHQTNDALLSYIDQGVKRAKSYGATDNDAFGLFIVMLSEFGDDFDTDKNLPWIGQTLGDKSVKDANHRIRNLAAMCEFYLSNLDNDQEQMTRSEA